MAWINSPSETSARRKRVSSSLVVSLHCASSSALADRSTDSEVQAWQLQEHSPSASCWRSPSPTPRRRPWSSAWPSALTAPGRTSRPRKPSRLRSSGGDYESKAVGTLDRTGTFSVPLAADLHGADCVVQLHSASSNAPCPGQEPSKIMPVSEGTTYNIVAGDNTATPSAASPECASMTLCGPIKKHIMEHFHHKKPVPPKPEPKPQPHLDYGPVPKPEPKPQPHPDYHPVPPTPTYGGGGGGGYDEHH
ncbi:uncharacterized protein LOC119360394 [Triticum dicoccoides]|uniref:uncharacterized protein LOC119360394 n=1 Tax=Triticum dicoccoides TaxID=85692 RepID=UPI00188E5942|nr:uncharacterized protein LOC119360394 [Triticum dicoccoides]